MFHRTNFVLAATVLVATASPASADTKAGVDAYQRGEYATAVKIWRPLAIAGDADAQYNLGQAYKLGRGVPVDPKMAEDWYRKAADQNHPLGRDAYGLTLFQNGNRQAALPYIEESAGHGQPQAQYVFATLLFNGDMVAKDWVRSYALMTRASAAGVSAASAGLAQLDRYIPLDQRQRGLALARAFETAAAKPQAVDIGAPTAIATEELPPSEPAVATSPTPVAVAVAVKPPAPVKPVVVKSGPVKPVVVKAVPAIVRPVPVKATAPAAVGGNWKVQLGAFGTTAKASALWGSLHARIAALGPYQSFVVPAGAVTRLRAGPLPSRAAADKLCGSVKAAGQPCIPVAP